MNTLDNRLTELYSVDIFLCLIDLILGKTKIFEVGKKNRRHYNRVFRECIGRIIYTYLLSLQGKKVNLRDIFLSFEDYVMNYEFSKDSVYGKKEKRIFEIIKDDIKNTICLATFVLRSKLLKLKDEMVNTVQDLNIKIIIVNKINASYFLRNGYILYLDNHY